MTLQERLEQYGNYETVKPDWDKFEGAEQFEVVGGNASLRDRAIKAIEKDILELIGEDERKPEAAVLGIDGRKKYAPGQVASHVKARNELRAELRLKLKEYIGTLDRSTNSNAKLNNGINKENN
jgi:predicted component of type VI protein secretion system